MESSVLSTIPDIFYSIFLIPEFSDYSLASPVRNRGTVLWRFPVGSPCFNYDQSLLSSDPITRPNPGSDRGLLTAPTCLLNHYRQPNHLAGLCHAVAEFCVLSGEVLFSGRITL